MGIVDTVGTIHSNFDIFQLWEKRLTNDVHIIERGLGVNILSIPANVCNA